MAGRFSVEAVFKAIDRVTAPVSRMQNRVSKFTRSMERGLRRVDRITTKLTGNLKQGFRSAAVSMLVFGAAVANVTNVGADFGRAIGSAAAKFPEQIQRGTQAFEDLEIAARQVGATTEFTATAAARGLDFLAKAGFSAQFSIKALPDIIDFATASGIELAEASDIASDALGAFGLNSEDLDEKMKGLIRIMDVMSKTANSTNTSVSELFESVKDGAPISSAAGVSLETFSATMGFLASNGIKASKAGTAAKNITLALAGVGNKAAVVFRRLDISLAGSNGQLRDQFDVLDDLRGKLKEFGQQKQVEIIAAIFGKIPIAAATKLLSDAGKSVRGLRTELENAGGSSKRTAEFIRDDMKGSLDSMFSAIESVKISIFSLNEGPLRDAVDGMTKWIRKNEEAIAGGIGDFVLDIVENFDELVDRIALIAKGIAIFLILSVVLKTFIAIMTLVNLVMAANPIVLIVIGVLLLIAAFVALVVWVDNIKAGFDGLGIVVKFLLAPFLLLIKTIQLAKDLLDDKKSISDAFGRFFLGDKQPVLPETPVPTTPGDITLPAPRLLAQPFDESALSSSRNLEPINLTQQMPDVSLKSGSVNVVTPETVIPNVPDLKLNTPKILAPEITPKILAPEITPKILAPEITPKILAPEIPAPEVKSNVIDIAKIVGNFELGFNNVDLSIPNAIVDLSRDDQDDGNQSVSVVPQVVSPQERIARTIEERKETSAVEITLKDETGRAEVTQGKLGPSVQLLQSGEF